MTKIAILPNVKVCVKTELDSQSQPYKGNCETRGRMTHIPRKTNFIYIHTLKNLPKVKQKFRNTSKNFQT